MNRLLILTVLTLLNLSCVREKAPETLRPYADRIAQTIARFNAPYEKVWKTTLLVLTLEFGYGIDVKEHSSGLIVSEWLHDRTDSNTQFQVNVKISASDHLTYVTIFKREEKQKDGKWTAVPSDYVLEHSILESIAKHLNAQNQVLDTTPPPLIPKLERAPGKFR